jgi:hypothetical protein
MASSLPDKNPNLPGLVPNGNPVKYAQYLQKQTTGAVKLWKPRYFVIANNTLWYFKDKGTAIVGSEVFKVDLQRCSVRQLSEKGAHYVEFVFSTAAATVETMLLKTASAGDAEKWFEKVQESKAAAGTPSASFLATPPAAAPAASTPQGNVGTGSPQTNANKPSLRSSSSQRLPPPIAPSPALTERSVATSQLSSASGPTLWDKLVSTVPEQFPPAYPVSDCAAATAAAAAAAAAATAAAQDDVTMTTVMVR